jgi:hypothetical protein
MPVVGSSGYGTASGVLSLVRSLLDDAAVSTGDVFTDSVLIPFVNSAYHQVQFDMANSGIETFIKDNVVLTVPAVTGVDPSIQVVCNDTQNQMTTVAPTPQIPTDLLVPVRIWERQTGSSCAGVRTALYEAANVILTRTRKGSSLKKWAMGVAKRAGMRKAKVALARKLAVVMHRMLADGVPFVAQKGVAA